MATKYRSPIARNVSATPTDPSVRKNCISDTDSGAAISAPPPKPMIASPAASPRRSGNHFTSTPTGVT
jgi:hypothetical protein